MKCKKCGNAMKVVNSDLGHTKYDCACGYMEVIEGEPFDFNSISTHGITNEALGKIREP